MCGTLWAAHGKERAQVCVASDTAFRGSESQSSCNGAWGNLGGGGGKWRKEEKGGGGPGRKGGGVYDDYDDDDSPATCNYRLLASDKGPRGVKVLPSATYDGTPKAKTRVGRWDWAGWAEQDSRHDCAGSGIILAEPARSVSGHGCWPCLTAALGGERQRASERALRCPKL